MLHMSFRLRLIATLFVGLVFTAGIVFWMVPSHPLLAQTVMSNTDPITTAWDRVQEAGSYHFSSDVTQTTTPSASVLNVGRRSRTDQIYLEGMADIDTTAMTFRLWSENGSLLQDGSSLAVRVADGKTYTRQNAGDWVEATDFTQTMAPAGDFMSYLVAARDITDLGEETRAGLTFTRYAFTLDGPTFARSVQEQMVAAMRQKGDVPPGISFEVPAHYRDMTGHGELWVGQDGLPLRQMLALQFPEQNDESVSAHITVSFSRFGYAKGATVAQAGSNTTPSVTLLSYFDKATFNKTATNLGLAATLLLVVVLMVSLYRYRHMRLLQHALSLAIIISFVVGPLLSSFRITNFFEGQTARAEAQESQVAKINASRRVQDATSAPAFDPHHNPLAAVSVEPTRSQSPSIAGLAAPMGAPALQATNILTTPNGLDSDGDGLTDFAEQRIGTDPALADTDGDTIPDDLEVLGFAFGGQTWYSDPNNADSNNDGVADLLEWDTDGNNVADDTDGDGTPDLFDEDNDNDGVPDHKDLSPFTKSATVFNETTPFTLQIENLSSHKFTVVDFQLRPTNEDQLWFAFNLLDWPLDDEGQIRDIDGQPEDLKLVPMLEITIPDGVNSVPLESDLQAYQISVWDGETAGDKVAYVPLVLETDPKSGKRVAFSGRMPYVPEFTSHSQSVKLVWLVQMQNDLACDPNNADDVANGCTSQGYLFNRGQIIHRYYEDWILTGLNVSENFGTKIATIHEDLSLDPDRADDGPMWLLSTVLEERFLKPAGGAGNYQPREITMDNIAAKLDANTIGVGNPGIHELPNRFKVTQGAYTTLDNAIYGMSNVISDTILTAFNPSDKPLLAFAYETKARMIGLDANHIDSSYAAMNGAQLTINFQPGDQTTYTQVDTLAGFKWNPYCHTGGTSGWAICDAQAYLNELEARHQNQFFDPETQTLVTASELDPDVARATTLVTQLYALALQQGINNLVQQDDGAGNVRIVSGLNEAASDAELEGNVRSGLTFGGAIAKAVANKALIKAIELADDLIGVTPAYKNLLKVDDRGTINTIKSSRLLTGATIVLVAVMLTAFILARTGNETAAQVFDILAGIGQIALSVFVPLRMASIAAQTAGTSVVQVLRGLSQQLTYTKTAAYIGAVISVGITWGFFIYSVVSNDIAFGSPAFNAALAETIAATIYIILLTVLALTGVGLIIVGIISAIDIILTLFCKYDENGESLESDFTGGCFTLSTAATKVIASLLYSYDIMVDAERDDLIATGTPTIGLVNPDLGYVNGAALAMTLPLTTSIVHKNPEPENAFKIFFYLWYFSERNLKSSSFNYSLTSPISETLSAERHEMLDAWDNPAIDHNYAGKNLYRTRKVDNVTIDGDVQFDQPGLNRAYDLYLNMAYALPAFECWHAFWAYPPVPPVCYQRSFKSDSSTQLDPFLFDILPDSLNGFISVAEQAPGNNRYALDWDASFTPLVDADGDGLISTGNGGLDVNDNDWDNDNDGLSDGFEIEQRAAGLPYAPNQCDTDGDGLTDKQEAQFGTNPGRADSDNDGLRDGDEIWHQEYVNCQLTTNWRGGWEVTINEDIPFTIHVSSNPLVSDSDGDSVSDLAEKQLAESSDPMLRVDTENRPWHPTVVNVPPIAVFVEVDDADRVVGSGQTVFYTSTVVTSVPIEPSLLDVNAPAAMGGPKPPVLLAFDPGSFSTEQTVSSQTNFTVGSGSNGQQLDLTSSVRARLESSGPAPFAWDPVILQPLNNAEHNLWGEPGLGMGVASFGNRQDSYLLGSFATFEPNLDFLTAFANTLPNGSAYPISIGFDYPSNDFGPDIACNNAGYCKYVFEKRANSSNWRNVVIVDFDPTGTPIGNPRGTGGFDNNRQPVVASHGSGPDDFVVAYHYTASPVESFLRLTLNGSQDFNDQRSFRIGPSRDIYGPFNDDEFSPLTTKDLVWIGDRYRLVYKRPVFNDHTGPHEIFILDFDQNLNLAHPEPGIAAVPNTVQPINANTSLESAPVLAYDPVHQQTLMLYQTTTGEARRILIPNNADISGGTYTFDDEPLGYYPGTTNPITGGNFAATFDQRLDKWLVTVEGQALYFPWDWSPEPIVNLIDVSPGFKVPVACPADSSLPVIDLHFEELPGATLFANSDFAARTGGDATCSSPNCPAAGLAGAVDSNGIAIGSPASDYAVQFDGIDDLLTMSNPLGTEFSVAFWVKSSTSGLFHIRSNENGAGGNNPGFEIRIGASSVVEVTAGGSAFAQATGQSLSKWSYVVATRASNGLLSIYVDGVLGDTVAGSPVPVMGPNIRIDGTNKTTLDNLQFYNVALNAATVQELYNGTTPSYCVGVDDDSWAKLNISQGPGGGKITASGGLALTLDTDLPTANVISLESGASNYIMGNTTLTIGGEANDAASGISLVEVKVDNGPWEPATGAESWAYNLPVTEGRYAVQVRATDGVGNVGPASAPVLILADTTPPTVTIDPISTAAIVPTRNSANLWTVRLTGTTVDPFSGGVSSGLPFNSQSIEVRLQGQGTAQGNGWQRIGPQFSSWTMNYLFAPGQLDPTGTYTVSVRTLDRVGNRTGDNGATAILRLDATGPAAALSAADVARESISDTLTISGVVTDTGVSGFLSGVTSLEAAFVSIEDLAALPTDISAAQADSQLNRTWLPVDLTQPGAEATAWSLTIPADLEGRYQIDLRATDSLGNLQHSDNAWRGFIDTLAPRVVMSATPTGLSHTVGNIERFEIQFVCAVEDRFLEESTFDCPGEGLAEPVRAFDTNPDLQALFPDLTLRNGLAISYTRWMTTTTPAAKVSACDTAGNCNEASLSGTVAARTAVARAAAPGAPKAVIVNPTRDSYVATTSGLNVTVAAEAGASLKEVTITLDNTIVETLSFAQTEVVTRVVRTINIPVVSDGIHTLVAQATDWTDEQQQTLSPLSFTFDSQPPVVTLDTDLLRLADTWAQGSDVLRFNGTASDNIELATVQIKIGDASFVDVNFDGSTWQTAQYVADPEGETLAVTVRAIDRSGQRSDFAGIIGVDLTPTDVTITPPETTLAPTVVDPSINSVSVSFAGMDGSNEVATFECRLNDGAFEPCESPQQVDSLNNGLNRFEVRAIDTEGIVDPTPASEDWTIAVAALQTTISQSPSNPTESRDATFDFSGAANFECALDEVNFSICSSPQSFTNLSDGEHTFLVRGVDGNNIGAATRFTWTVNNAAPVAASQTVSTNENSAIDLTLSASDADPLTFKITDPAHGVLSGIPPAVTYSPNTDYTGSDSFTFVANDGLVDSNIATVTINVTTNNTDSTPPTITSQVAGTLGNDGWYVSDVDLSWNVVDAESAITDQTGCDPITIATETVGQPFTCSATSSGGTATESVTIKLDKTAPETTLTAQPNDPSNTVSATFAFTGTDNLSSIGSFECSLDGGDFEICTNPQIYTGLDNGSHTFAVRAIDGAGNVDQTPTNFTWTVDLPPANQAPNATEDAYTTAEETVLMVNAPGVLDNDSDPEDDTLSAVLVDDVSNGTLTLNADGSYSYTPNAGFTGDDRFTYVANDGLLPSNVATATITVNAGTAPFATCGGYDVFETAPGVYEAPSFAGNLIVGDNGYNWLTGTNGNDLILGLDGPDDIFGKNGDDVICGGNGLDIIKGQNGDDIIYGDNQHDWLIGGNGDDILYGGNGWDDLEGNNGKDTLYGEDGYDVLLGGNGADDLFGGDGPDDLYGQNGNDNLNGGNDNDFCRGGSGNDTLDNCEAGSAKDGNDVAEMNAADIKTALVENDNDGEFTITLRIQDTYLPFITR